MTCAKSTTTSLTRTPSRAEDRALAARFYDALSGERVVYRAGRECGVALLGLRSGDTVLDLACGTGLNFALLVYAVGPSGAVIGLDRIREMLEMARRLHHHSDERLTLLSVSPATLVSDGRARSQSRG